MPSDAKKKAIADRSRYRYHNVPGVKERHAQAVARYNAKKSPEQKEQKKIRARDSARRRAAELRELRELKATMDRGETPHPTPHADNENESENTPQPVADSE